MKILQYFCLCVSLVIAGCSKTPDYTFTKMSNQEVYNFLYYSNHVRAVFGPEVTAASYSIPSEQWIKDVYAPYLESFLFENGVDKYQNPENNCVKFSCYGLTSGLMLHYKAAKGIPKTSLAIGLVDYVVDLDMSHSINFFIARGSNGILKIIYFEPQSQQVVDGNEIETDWVMVRM